MTTRILVTIDCELEDLIPGFLDNRRDDVMEMTRALAAADFETVRDLGHSMKGAGGGYGFDAITEIGGMLEKLAKDRNATGVRHAIAELVDYLERVEVRYE